MKRNGKNHLLSLVITVFLCVLFAFGCTALSETGSTGVLQSVRADVSADNTIKLTWDKISGVTYYNVYKYDQGKKEYVISGSTTENSYSIKGCKADTSYNFVVAPVIKIDGNDFESSVSPCVEVSYSSTMPSSLKKTYSGFRSGTFGVIYTVPYVDRMIRTETYVKNGSCLVVADLSAEGMTVSARIYSLKDKNTGYIVAPMGATGFYAEISKDTIKANGMDIDAIVSASAPESDGKSTYIIEKRDYKGKVCTFESYVAKNGIRVAYGFDASGNLAVIEERDSTGVCKVTEATGFTASVEDKAMKLPLLFPMGWVKTDFDFGSHSHYDADKNGACDYCNGAVEVPVHSHAYPDSWSAFTYYTCTKDGVEIKKCGSCNTIEIRKVQKKHDGKVQSAKAATCTEKGYTEGTYCEKCKTWISGHNEIAALGHKWKDATCTEAKTCMVCKATEGGVPGHKWVDATCTTKKTCSVCKATEGSVPGHKWVKATCTEPKKCSSCNLTEGSPLGHKWKDATCEVPKTCKTCKITEGEAPGHKWIEATCTTKKTCSVCGKKEGSSLGHKWTGGSCTEPRVCSVCKAVKDEIPSHKWKDATCSAPKTCKVCKITEGKIVPENHKWKAATCTKAKRCSLCKKTEGEPLGHKVKTVKKVNPTCTEKGYTKAKMCKVCGKYTVKPVEIAPSGHKEEILPAVPATYTSNGKTEGKQCTVCKTVTVEQKKISRKKLSKVKELKTEKVTDTKVTLSWKKVKGAESYEVSYSADGKKWTSITAKKTTVKVKKLSSLVKYQFKVRAVAGKYKGSYCKAIEVTTKLPKVTGVKVESSEKGCVAVSWKEVKSADGYIVEYSTSKKFTKKSKKSVKIKKGTEIKTTLKKLESKEKYYVRVRAYKTVDKKTVKGDYSSVSSVKVK